MRATIAPAQAERTQLQLVRATAARVQGEAAVLQQQLAEVQVMVDGLDVNAINATLLDYGARLSSLEQEP